MNWQDRLIASCASWNEFWERTNKLSTDGKKGAAFERLTQLYLQTTPEYRAELRHVWTLRELPPDICKRLDLPSRDEGIDLIACTRHGEYWAIQSKFRSQRDKPLNRKELGTFSSLAFNTCSNIALAVVAHTCSKPISKRHLMRNTTEIGLDRWQFLNQEAWRLIVAKLKGRSARPEVRHLWPHQRAAISAAKSHFIGDGAARGRLIMPCGTGKSLTAYWIAEALKAKTILVAVPSLALVRQSLADWTREFLAHNVLPDWLCVCSDESVGNLERDEFVGEVYDLGLPTHTDTSEIAALLRAPSNGPKIVFTTYQSSDKLAAAARKARIKFDLAILDEAHKTVGVHSKRFATLLRGKKINIRHRVFMTATERVFRGDSNDVLSMDSEKDYGKRFFHLSFKEAIKQRIITDYKILTMTVSDRHIRELINENRILNLNSRDLDEAEAQSIAAGIALKRIYKGHGVKHAISFHRSIRGADRFREQQDALNRMGSLGPKTTNLHISSKKTAGQRSDLLREFVVHKRALMTNARCLTEGVDVPAIDCVMFADPKQSRVDIVQATGRALRRYKGKEHGYIVVPLVVPEKMDFEKFAETTAFKQVARTITALSTQDERIADEFRAIEQGRVSSGKIVEIDGDIPVGMKMKLGDFAEAISTRIWGSVGRANWRKFEDARAFVRKLGLKNGDEWREYRSSDRMPADIPAAPDAIYAEAGWTGYGDWLGTGNVAFSLRQYLPFNRARAFARGLGLKSTSEWRDYCKSGKKPIDIPSKPERYDNWVGYDDWLGTKFQFQPFRKARAYVRRLGLKSSTEWNTYCKSGKKPRDIPAGPQTIYADAGWAGMSDWLGTGRLAPGKSRSFRQARTFARSLGLKSSTAWFDYCRSGEKPTDIPYNPQFTYAEAGWAGYGDWLGTGRVAPGKFKSFKLARNYVHRLGLKSRIQWNEYCASGKKPADIPAAPQAVYAETGWAGYGDWLKTGMVATHLRQYKSFKEARAYVHGLGLKSEAQLRTYCKSGKKPDDIPAHADRTYANAGWAGIADWLGCVGSGAAENYAVATHRRTISGKLTVGTGGASPRHFSVVGKCPT
jgi:superfamily II DNA or RNA helicase